MRSTLREDQVTDNEFLSPEEYEGMHNRDSYTELTRDTLGNIITIEEWYSTNKLRKLKEINIYRTDDVIDHVLTTIYNYTTGSGITATISGTLYRHEDFMYKNIDDRDNDMEGI